MMADGIDIRVTFPKLSSISMVENLKVPPGAA